MSHPFQITLDAFISAPSLTNAKKVVAHARKHPFVLCMLTEDHAGMVRNAERMVAGTAAGKAFRFVPGK